MDFWDAELLDFAEEALVEAPADLAEEAVAAIAEACNAAGANIAAESKTAEKFFFHHLLGIYSYIVAFNYSDILKFRL